MKTALTQIKRKPSLAVTALFVFATPILSASAFAAPDCTRAGLAVALDRLQPVGRLHNCQIELVTRRSSAGLKQYMLLVNDLSPLGDVEHPALSFEMEIDPACETSFAEPLEHRTFTDSFGYTDPDRDYRVSIQLQMGWAALPRSLSIQEINLLGGQVKSRVECRLDWENP